jgi:hypothetical protein
MTMQNQRLARKGAVLGLALAAALFAARPVAAQPLSPDPYNPWTSMYTPFTYPMAPGSSPSIPNQARVGLLGPRGVGGEFSLDGANDNLFGRGGNRRLYYNGDDLGVGGAPELNADQKYYQDRLEREKRYFEAQREKDPKKRAALLRQWEAENRRANLNMSRAPAPASRTRRSAAGAATARAAGAAGTRAATPRPSRGETRGPAAAPPNTPAAANRTTPAPRPPGTPAIRRPERGRELTPAETLRRAEESGRTGPPASPPNETEAASGTNTPRPR